MSEHVTKQQIHGGSAYHQRRHEEAQARIATFAALRAAGWTDSEIGVRYKVSRNAVYQMLKRAKGLV